MPVWFLKRNMPSSELTEWEIVYRKIQPFGEDRADIRAGMVASPLLNIQLAKSSTPSKPTDWMFRRQAEQPEVQTPDQMKKIFQVIASALRGKAKGRPKATKVERVRITKPVRARKSPVLDGGVPTPPPQPDNATQGKQTAPSHTVKPPSSSDRRPDSDANSH